MKNQKDPFACGDTMLLRTDKKVIVQVIDIDEERIRFSYCSDSSGSLYERPTNSVKTIFYSDGSVDEIGKRISEEGFEVRDPPVLQEKYVFDHDPSHLSKGSSNCIDEMHLKNGQMLKVKVVEVNTRGVKYKKCDDPLGRKFEKQSKYISKIKYADGFEEEIREPHMYDSESELSTGAKVGRVIGFTVLGIVGLFLLGLIIILIALLN